MTARTGLLSFAAVVFTFALAAPGLWEQRQMGYWPDDWPKAMEPLRAQARTIDVANGTQEQIYEITFKDRGQFEAAWPAILSVKTFSAPLRLYDVGPVQKGSGLVHL